MTTVINVIYTQDTMLTNDCRVTAKLRESRGSRIERESSHSRSDALANFGNKGLLLPGKCKTFTVDSL